MFIIYVIDQTKTKCKVGDSLFGKNQKLRRLEIGNKFQLFHFRST